MIGFINRIFIVSWKLFCYFWMGCMRTFQVGNVSNNFLSGTSFWCMHYNAGENISFFYIILTNVNWFCLMSYLCQFRSSYCGQFLFQFSIKVRCGLRIRLIWKNKADRFGRGLYLKQKSLYMTSKHWERKVFRCLFHRLLIESFC